MAKNLKGKTRPQDRPYEVYEGEGFVGKGFIYKVLKHYQDPENEAKNPYARVFCATQSPYTYGEWELGDAYLHAIVRDNRLTFQDKMDEGLLEAGTS